MSKHTNGTYEEMEEKGKGSGQKSYENEKIAKQYDGKVYKTMLISSTSLISISLPNGVAMTINFF